jgi:hypothetical protein
MERDLTKDQSHRLSTVLGIPWSRRSAWPEITTFRISGWQLGVLPPPTELPKLAISAAPQASDTRSTAALPDWTNLSPCNAHTQVGRTVGTMGLLDS